MTTGNPRPAKGDCQHSLAWNSTPTVSVLVLNWNGERFLRACLGSLVQDACPHVEIVLVDNGSNDGSLALVRKEFPQVRIIANGSNLGFSRGYNAAVPQARGRFLVFLNNDTVVEPGWLIPLIDRLLEDSSIGITTCKLLFLGTRILNNAGGYLKLWTGCGELGYGRDGDYLPKNKVVEPFYGAGAAMAIRRELFERLGGFDDAIFAYGEDLDLSWRVRLAGYKVRYVPESVVHHHFSGTWGVFNPRKVRMVTRHHIRAMVKSLSWANLLHALPAYVLFALAKGTALSVVKKSPSYLVSVVLALGDLVRNWGELWQQRRATQKLRVVPDRKVLKSEGFGLLDTPWEFWRVLRVAQKVRGKGEPIVTGKN